jgi:GNAT superfamily N-acetyltransferase
MTRFRAYEDGDAEAVAGLVDPAAPPLYVWKLHALHGPERADPPKRTRLALGPDGTVMGAVTVGVNPVHLGQYSFAVTVGPAYRRRGLGRELVAEGRRMRTDARPLVTQVYEFDAAGLALVRAEGGKVVQRAPEHRFDPASAAQWCAVQPVPPGVTITGLDAVGHDELIRIWRDMYVWQHADWTLPPLDLPALTRHVERVAGATAKEASAAAWVGGRPVAYAAALIDPGGETEIVSETARRDEPDGTALVAAVVAECLRRLAARGVRAAMFDGHLSDPHFYPATRALHPDGVVHLLVVRLP